MIYFCHDCGGPAVIAGSAEADENPKFPVVGTTIDDQSVCDVCIGNRTQEQLAEGLDTFVYISEDGRSFQTWGGTKVGTVHELGGIGGIWSAQSISRMMLRLPVKAVHWSGVTLDGVLVYGRTQGPCMAATAHPRRSHGRLQVEQGSRLALERSSL